MLKMVPRISPLPMGFKPNRKNETPANIASVIAKEQYFFCVCLICSIMTVFVFENFHDLAVDNHCSADDAEDDKYDSKWTFNSQPLIYLEPDIKTKTDTSDHGKPQLHDNLHVFRPGLILFVIKYFFIIHRFTIYIG